VWHWLIPPAKPSTPAGYMTNDFYQKALPTVAKTVNNSARNTVSSVVLFSTSITMPVINQAYVVSKANRFT